MYESDDNSTRLCVMKAKCQELGYELRIQCLTKKQCEDRVYYETSNKTHTCVPISTCPEGEYNETVDCVSREECTLLYDWVIERNTCLSRDMWINLDPRNFVDLNLEVQIYTDNVDETSDASVLCRTRNGNAVETVTLYLGKFCQCPDTKPYFDRKD